MDLNLENKTVMVIGASSGIGAATAHIFAQEGAHVVIAYGSDTHGAQQTLQAVQGAGRNGWLCSFDLRQPQAAKEAAQRIRQEAGGLDSLILCAGENLITPYDQITAQEWEQVIGVNLNGAFFAIQAMVPLIRPGGSIVTVASVAAHTGAPHHMHYAAAKAGLVNLTKSLARALAPAIRVNCVAPGITLTPMGEETVQNLDPRYAETRLLVQRYATPEEIGRVIVFTASPLTGFMTGATLDINGGRELR